MHATLIVKFVKFIKTKVYQSISVVFGWLFILQMLHFNLGNNKVMKLLCCGRFCCTCTSSTLRIGITVVQCPSSYFCMVLLLLLSIHLSVSALASKFITSSSVSSVFQECTSITFIPQMCVPRGSESYT
jgi:hypothetical protein